MAESYVGKPCPKCRHVRAANEVAPDWQCPKCGVAYAKAAGAQSPAPAAAATATVPAAVPAARTGYVARPAAAAGGGSTGLAMFAHLSLLIGYIIPFFGLIVPIVIWITKKDSDELATANAKEAINFQISVLLWVLLIVGLSFAGPGIYLAGLIGVVLILAMVIMPIIAAVKANGGDQYRYPMTLHVFS
jgi:uncharacterized Tic20 family protein